jgi:hypothetical protein
MSYSCCESHVRKTTEDLEEWGRGFSINQVQNGGTDSLWMIDLSMQFVLSALRMAGSFT